MRIVAGIAKGKKLEVPPGNIRPLSSQAREGLFNILQRKTPDSRFLDLFAGTGAVGIEALSRGATCASFVELDKRTVKTLRKNLQHCGFSDTGDVYNADVLRGLKILKRKGEKFDIIFIGAPYGSPVLSSVLSEISDAILLEDGGVVIAEHRKQHKLDEHYGSLACVRVVRYGDTELNFYENSHLSGKL
jgi:16S rRNA (guanine(966)-N(2))-methyltransferase RsmD